MAHHVFVWGLLWLMTRSPLLAHSAASADTVQTGRNEHPEKPKFIAELDQRFFFFKEATLPLLHHPTSVWGGRVGLLLPCNIKAGIGYYFTTQRINESWEGYQITYRRLHYATAYVEPYFFRRTYWELSAPVEAGLGSARYELTRLNSQQPNSRQTVALPLSVGLSVSLKFPSWHGLRPLRWFGVNLMTGYRYTLQQHVPVGPPALNGVYYSVSPAVFLDRFYQDLSAWRKVH